MLRHAKWQFAVPTWLSNNCKVMCFKMISIWVYSLLWKVCGRGLTWFYSHRDWTAAFHFGQVGSIVWIDHINGTARVNAWILHVQRLNCDTTRHFFWAICHFVQTLGLSVLPCPAIWLYYYAITGCRGSFGTPVGSNQSALASYDFSVEVS